jgi:hypothetical protein
LVKVDEEDGSRKSCFLRLSRNTKMIMINIFLPMKKLKSIFVNITIQQVIHLYKK